MLGAVYHTSDSMKRLDVEANPLASVVGITRVSYPTGMDGSDRVRDVSGTRCAGLGTPRTLTRPGATGASAPINRLMLVAKTREKSADGSTLISSFIHRATSGLQQQ